MLKGCDKPDEFQEKNYMEKFLFEHLVTENHTRREAEEGEEEQL